MISPLRMAAGRFQGVGGTFCRDPTARELGWNLKRFLARRMGSSGHVYPHLAEGGTEPIAKQRGLVRRKGAPRVVTQLIHFPFLYLKKKITSLFSVY